MTAHDADLDVKRWGRYWNLALHLEFLEKSDYNRPEGTYFEELLKDKKLRKIQGVQRPFRKWDKSAEVEQSRKG